MASGIKEFEVLAVFRVIDHLTRPIDEMAKAVDGLKKSLEAVKQRFEDLQDAGERMAKFGAVITAPFAGAAYAAVEFEKTVVGEFNKVADLPEKQLAGFKKFFMDLSQQIPLSANEIAKLSANLAQMGVPTDQLKEFTEMVSKAAFAFDMVAEEAGRAFGEIRSAYGIGTVKQLKEIGDTINYLSNTMGANAEQLVEIVRRVGSSARQFGLSAKSVAVFGAVLKEQGMGVEVIGTGLSTALQRLQIMNDQAKEALATIGMTVEEFDEIKKKSPEKALITLLERVKALDAHTQAEVLYKIFGLEHTDEILGLVNNLDRLKQKLAEIEAGKYAGSMDAEVKKLMQTTWAQLQVLKHQLQNLAIIVGSLLLPPIKTFVSALTSALKPVADFIQAHQTLAKVLVYPVVGIGLLLTALGSLAVAVGWVGKNIFDGLVLLTAFAKRLQQVGLASRLTAFATMPLNAQLKLLNAKLKALGVWSWNSLKSLYSWVRNLTITFWQANVAVVRFTVATLRLQTVEQIKGAFNAVIAIITSLRKAIWGFIATNPYLIAFAVVAGLIYKFWRPIKAFFVGLFEGLKEGFAEAFAPLKPILSPVIGVFKTLFGWIGKLLKPVDDAKEGFQNVAFVGRALGYALSYFLIPLKLVIWALGFLKKVISSVAEFISTHWKTAVKVFLWTNPITAPIMAFKKLYGFIKSLNLFEAGKQIIEGLWKGIVSMAKKPIEAIKSIGHSIKEKFKSILGISSPSKLFMQFGHFLNEGLGLGMLKSLGVVKNAVKRVTSVFDLPAKKEIQFLPKLALEGLKTLALPASLAVSLFSPVNAISSPVKEIQKVFNTAEVHQIESKKLVRSEKVFQTEKLLKAEKVLKEKLVTERIEREAIDKPPIINLTLNFSPVINTENKEGIRETLQTYLPDFVKQVEEAIRKIEEQRARRTY